MFFIYTGILLVYLLAIVVLPLDLPLAFKITLGIIIFLGSQLHYISKKTSGMMIGPYPKLLLYVWEYFFAFDVILFLFSIPYNVINIISTLFSHSLSSLLFNGIGKTALIITSALFALYSFYQGNKIPKIKHVKIGIKDWPEELDGYKIVQLTDLHISGLLTKKWLQEVVDKTNNQNPNLIVITGDFTDGYPSMYAENLKPLKSLQAHHGVYGCLGNHDYYYDYNGWTDEYRKNNVSLLINEHVLIGDEYKFMLAGVSDRVAKNHNQEAPDIKKAIGNDKQYPVILLDHRPDTIYQNVEYGVDLQLSGHTHGGMMPILAQIVKRANKGFNSGLYNVENSYLYLSNGTGIWNGFPLRLGYQSEITTIYLHNQNNIKD